MAKKAVKVPKASPIPKTAKHAVAAGYEKTAAAPPPDPSAQWALVKPAAAGRPHIVCYYDPATGEYTDCHVSDD